MKHYLLFSDYNEITDRYNNEKLHFATPLGLLIKTTENVRYAFYEK